MSDHNHAANHNHDHNNDHNHDHKHTNPAEACATPCADKKCCCPCHNMVGILIALIGVVFLLGNLEILSSKIVQLSWPIIVILIGLKKAFKGKCKCCKGA